jgi:phospholipase C
MPRNLFSRLLVVTALLSIILAVTADVNGKWFQRIFIIVFENQPILLTLLHPYFRELSTNKGALLNNFWAITHPSQPNYLTHIAGDYFGQNTDKDISFNSTVKTVVDLLEAKGVSWKAYQEDYPGNCYTGGNYQRLYYRKHNPFMSFENIRNDPSRCAKIVPANELYTDIANNKLPQYMYYTPNINNDGHDTGLKYADNYLRKFLDPLLSNSTFMNGTLVFVTFDEDNLLEGNHIFTSVSGPMIRPGYTDHTRYNHYSLLRTIEDNWDLGNLGRNDANANVFEILKNPTSPNIRKSLVRE